MALGVSNTNFLQHESALFNWMNMMLSVQARAGIWGTLMLYSNLPEACGQDNFALLFLLCFFFPNLLMLQEHLVKKHLLKPTVTEYWCCHVTVFIGSEAKMSLPQKIKSCALKNKMVSMWKWGTHVSWEWQLCGVFLWLALSYQTSLARKHHGGDAPCVLLSEGLINHRRGYPRDKARKRQCSSLIYL